MYVPDPFFLFTSAFERRTDAVVDTGRDYQSYILCAFVVHRSAYQAGIHDLDARCLQQVDAGAAPGRHRGTRLAEQHRDPDQRCHPQHAAGRRAGGNAALRDANLLSATLSAVHDGHAALLPALHRYENELRACGRSPICAVLRTQRQGLRSNRVAVAGARAWFRTCHAIPPLKSLNLPYREQARPRAWETSQIVTGQPESRIEPEQRYVVQG